MEKWKNGLQNKTALRILLQQIRSQMYKMESCDTNIYNFRVSLWET
jgi:hypothetical protein